MHETSIARQLLTFLEKEAKEKELAVVDEVVITYGESAGFDRDCLLDILKFLNKEPLFSRTKFILTPEKGFDITIREVTGKMRTCAGTCAGTSAGASMGANTDAGAD